MVAFHFQFANQAGWECDACRRTGLEKRRHCGFLGLADTDPQAVVWARKGVAASSCPKSYITGESESRLEDFLVRQRLGGLHVRGLNARQTEAFVILDQALRAELNDGHNGTRRDI